MFMISEATNPVMKRLYGKIAVVTGSTTGIGYSIAERLAREGAKVIISSRSPKLVEEATQKLREQNLEVTGMVCNVANAEERKNILKEAENIGGLDIFVNNAAVNPRVALCGPYSCPESAWDKIINVNLKMSYLFTKEALPLLRKSKSGRIIYIGTASTRKLQDDLGAYIVSKTALESLARTGALELGRENITVNCVAPGIIPTKFSEVLMADKEKYLRQLALYRFGTVEEISGVVAFLASDDGGYITGETLYTAGGI